MPTTIDTVPATNCSRRPYRPEIHGVARPLVTEPTAIAVPCRPASANEMSCSAAMSGTVGVNA
jgi:hypothetical protein